MKTFSGSKEIYDSGLVITFKDESLTFQVTSDLKITISFSDDINEKSQRIQSKPINNKELELVIINFNNALGTGTTEPLKLGVVDNQELFLNFVVYSLKDKSQKTFQYTWYLGEEVNHG